MGQEVRFSEGTSSAQNLSSKDMFKVLFYILNLLKGMCTDVGEAFDVKNSTNML